MLVIKENNLDLFSLDLFSPGFYKESESLEWQTWPGERERAMTSPVYFHFVVIEWSLECACQGGNTNLLSLPRGERLLDSLPKR